MRADTQNTYLDVIWAVQGAYFAAMFDSRSSNLRRNSPEAVTVGFVIEPDSAADNGANQLELQIHEESQLGSSGAAIGAGELWHSRQCQFSGLKSQF
jgi:hypothetical protein